MSSANRVRIVIDKANPENTVVEVNGVDLASVVGHISVRSDPGFPPCVTLLVWAERLELEADAIEVLKLVESVVDTADAKVIGVTEHGDLVHEAPAPPADEA